MIPGPRSEGMTEGCSVSKPKCDSVQLHVNQPLRLARRPRRISLTSKVRPVDPLESHKEGPMQRLDCSIHSPIQRDINRTTLRRVVVSLIISLSLSRLWRATAAQRARRRCRETASFGQRRLLLVCQRRRNWATLQPIRVSRQSANRAVPLPLKTAHSRTHGACATRETRRAQVY